jgi:predicted GIY-YIG superfamily endonuclease
MNAYTVKNKVTSRQVYVGQTDNLAKRLREHRTGNSIPTVHLQPLWLIGALEVPATDVALGYEAWLEARKDGANLEGKEDKKWKQLLMDKFKNLYTRKCKATLKDIGAMYLIEKAANWRKMKRNVFVEIELMKDQGSRLNIAARMMTRLLRLNLQNVQLKRSLEFSAASMLKRWFHSPLFAMKRSWKRNRLMMLARAWEDVE